MTGSKKNDPGKLERIIRKIKHCLALSGSSNEHEAALAMKQAKALMREYQVTEQMVAFSDIGEVKSEFSRAHRRPTWDRTLSVVVAEAFTCKVLRNSIRCPSRGVWIETAVFVGATPAQHIALYAYETLLRKLTADRKQYASEVRAGKRPGRFSPETCANHFALAWVEGVQAKLQELLPQGEEDLLLGSTGTNLVATADKHARELVSQYIASREIGTCRAQHRPADVDLDALLAGIFAGRAVEVHHALSTDGDDQLALADQETENADA